MANFLSNLGDFAGRVGDAAGNVQFQNLQFDDPDLYNQIVQQRQLGDLRQQELAERKKDRSREIEARKRFQEAIQNPEVLGKLSQQLGVPQELLSSTGSIAELGKLRSLTSPQGGATGVLVDRLMKENPKLSFGDALAQIQTGYRQGVTFGADGAAPILGLGEALGSLAGDENFGGTSGDLRAKLRLEPELVEKKAEAEVLGGGAITPVQQREFNIAEAKLAGDVGIRAMIDSADNINTVIDTVLGTDTSPGQTGAWTTGLGGVVTGLVAGSPAFDLKENMKTIEADAAFSTLQAMRESSKTGGALGAISERELGLLGAARAALSASQSEEQFRRNLLRYKKVRSQALENTKKAYKQEFGVAFGGKKTPSAASTVSLEDFLAE